MNLKPKFWKSCCPVCNSENKVYIYDHGFKFWRRFVAGNNRFACRNCRVTWRRKTPFDHTRLQKRNSAVSHTQVISRPYRIYLDFSSKLREKFRTYCIIGVLSAVFAYLIFGVFPSIFQELAPSHIIGVQDAGKKSGGTPELRNDKKSGDQELLKRRNGKKN